MFLSNHTYDSRYLVLPMHSASRNCMQYPHYLTLMSSLKTMWVLPKREKDDIL
jgi:hypothetical protein